jgi:phytoene dehydrogenase-like protein
VRTCDVAVIGAGFGGLATALELSRAGADVVLLEQLRYPGGCASTFTRGGARYEAGATLFSGFAEGQLFRQWIDELGLDVDFRTMDPLVELRTPSFRLAIPPERDAFLERLVALAPSDESPIRAFFAEQRKVADALWALFDEPALLPPFDGKSLFRHVRRAPRYLPLLRVIGLPLEAVLRRHGLTGCRPLRTFLDAVTQITVQCGVAEVEAPFALAAMDYYFRGTGHVHGGIGQLAWALARAAEAHGADLRFSDQVRAVERAGRDWRLKTRKGELRARRVVANLTPHALRRIRGRSTARLDRLARAVEGGWGAAMIYLRLRPGALPERPEAHHLELVGSERQPFIEGNHLFCSVSADDEERGPDGERTVTISTHVPMATLRTGDPAAYTTTVQERMARTLDALAPELARATVHSMTGSPRTFERFTGRDFGYVGGIPRTRGLHHYRALTNPPIWRDLWMVGDSVFPGQSTLATALGGVKVAGQLVGRADAKSA